MNTGGKTGEHRRKDVNPHYCVIDYVEDIHDSNVWTLPK